MKAATSSVTPCCSRSSKPVPTARVLRLVPPVGRPDLVACPRIGLHGRHRRRRGERQGRRVGLPFFADASVAPEYLAADKPTIMVRAFGTDLAAHARVTFSATSDTLGLRTGPIVSTALQGRADPPPAAQHRSALDRDHGSDGVGHHRANRQASSHVRGDSRRGSAGPGRRTSSRPVPTKVGGGPQLIDHGDRVRRVSGSLRPLARRYRGRQRRATRTRARQGRPRSSLLVDRFGAPAGTRGTPTSSRGGRYQNSNTGVSGWSRPAAVTSIARRWPHWSRPTASTAASSRNTCRTSAQARSRRANAATTRSPVWRDWERRSSRRFHPSGRPRRAPHDPGEADARPRGGRDGRLGDGSFDRRVVVRQVRRGARPSGSPTSGRQLGCRQHSEATALMAMLAAATGDARAPALWAYVEANPTSGDRPRPARGGVRGAPAPNDSRRSPCRSPTRSKAPGPSSIWPRARRSRWTSRRHSSRPCG